ncbi:cyclomaltodextrinase [Anopheles sinensis]|uniref:Cyclomaltodextrinase n=1 Tax=Anopheles sinensis TaxID=74873 RepID=A0A084WUB6_ANOSI|nr:cyclomaltodextrinase [Anopheles sinensis]
MTVREADVDDDDADGVRTRGTMSDCNTLSFGSVEPQEPEPRWEAKLRMPQGVGHGKTFSLRGSFVPEIESSAAQLLRQ